MSKHLAAAALLIVGVALGACTPNKEFAEDYSDPRGQVAKQGVLGGEGGPLVSIGRGRSGDQGSGGGGVGVSAYLWRGALETLSFMPLVSADPFGGVIITDWYQPAASNGERFKATAYILGQQLRADGVRVSVFRQVLQGGNWVDAPVAANAATELENRILARARDLRAEQVVR
ncbi:MAG: DUF3576 domain-containing protein [Acetobacteraceae bacterium]|nr:DUF3576 domain-containing protein [Acetobacteraceae bacterium]